LFDGDGCFYSYWDKRWRSSFIFYLSFCSASKKFLEWLQKMLFEYLEVRGDLKIRANIGDLIFAKKKV